jgi:AGCS family alanine or glycine:cation symporter
MIFAMSFGNIIGLYIMMPEVKRDLNGYLSRVATGEITETR